RSANMAHLISKATVLRGIAGALAIVAASPSLAQVVVVDPPYRYGPRIYVSPEAYGGYAYVPGYRYGYPIPQYDTGGAPYYPFELGWQPGPPGGAPSNPCYPGQRMQNRC